MKNKVMYETPTVSASVGLLPDDDYCYGHGAARRHPEESVEELHERMLERWRAAREREKDEDG